MSEYNIKVNSSPKLFLQQGDEFLEAAWRCAGRDNTGVVRIAEKGQINILPSAAVVNAVFSIEMYLKAILQKAGLKYPKNGRDGHDLSKLYNLLKDRKKETDAINAFVGKSKDGASLFEEFAKLHSQDFGNIRYYIEKSGWNGMDPLTVITYAFNLGQAAKTIVSME